MTNPIDGENRVEPVLSDFVFLRPFADPTHFEWYMFKDNTPSGSDSLVFHVTLVLW